MHYDNSENVDLDPFNYLMQIVNQQCDLYNQGKEFNEKSLTNKYKRPPTLCGFNSANYDLYFFLLNLYMILLSMIIIYIHHLLLTIFQNMVYILFLFHN